ncbi:MAG: tRNA 2-selenouridine(34) synthase MnmH, partial [Flavobacteriales bacterium]
MATKISILQPGDMLRHSRALLVDVRSPKEFSHSHIPGAVNLPLLNDEERHIVGLTYKENGSDKAVEKGFELVGGKFADYIREARSISQKREIVVYCWRGGMRSNIMAWVLELAGLPVSLIEGGYKQFRRTVLEDLTSPRNWIVVSGKTGTGKTEILHELANLGENVLDLEMLAHHKGSAFGALGQARQPSIEQFENKIAVSLAQLKEGPIWVEDESRWIGGIKIPDAIYQAMRTSRTLAISRHDDIRKQRILNEYGIFPKEQLAERTSQLQKRLGGDRMQLALEKLDAGDLHGWLDILMPYYDKMYTYGLDLRNQESVVQIETTDQD